MCHRNPIGIISNPKRMKIKNPNDAYTTRQKTESLAQNNVGGRTFHFSNVSKFHLILQLFWSICYYLSIQITFQLILLLNSTGFRQNNMFVKCSFSSFIRIYYSVRGCARLSVFWRVVFLLFVYMFLSGFWPSCIWESCFWDLV